MLAKHVRPQVHELGFVEATVLILVEHINQVPCHAVVEAHSLLDHRDYFVWTQNTVPVFVQFFEARRDILVPRRTTPTREISDRL